VARQQGAPLTLLINSGSVDFGLAMEEIPLVSEDAPRIEGMNAASTLQLDVNKSNTGLYDLIDAQRTFNAQTNNADTFRITATFAAALPNGSTAKYRFPKCTLHTATQAFSGSTERSTAPFSLTCQRPVRVS
jgi:hypothetical protein